MTEPTIVFAKDGCVMAHWCGISVVVWGTAATPLLVNELTRLTEIVASTHPRGSSVHLVVNDAGPPTREGRAALWGLTKRAESRLVCTAAWVEGGSFWAGLIRSLMTSLDLVMGHRLKLRTFTDLDELAAWVIPLHAEALGQALSPVEFVRVLRWLREQPAVASPATRRSAS